MPRSRSFTRFTIRVGLLHLGQSVDFVVSMIFLRSPVFAIFAICRLFLLVKLSLLTRAKSARGFNLAAFAHLPAQNTPKTPAKLALSSLHE